MLEPGGHSRHQEAAELTILQIEDEAGGSLLDEAGAVIYGELSAAALNIRLAAVYPPGSEPAIGDQDIDRVAPNGRELATVANAGRATIAGAALDQPLTG
jgi:hypothetical protein